MKITMLGTGHAVVTSCYNTCYVMEDGERRLLVDGGGGISLLRQLKAAGIRWNTIHEIFVTHRHLDHITGILWMMRMLGGPLASGKMKEDVFVYGHDEVIGILDQMIRSLLPERAEKCLQVTVKHQVVVKFRRTIQKVQQPIHITVMFIIIQEVLMLAVNLLLEEIISRPDILQAVIAVQMQIQALLQDSALQIIIPLINQEKASAVL